LLAFALVCIGRLFKASTGFKPNSIHAAPLEPRGGKDAGAGIPGGGMFAGFTEIAKSPYLIGIGLFVGLFTWTSTFIYFQQANIVADAFDNPVERTQLFAFMDVSVAILTITAQAFITGRFIKKFGVSSAVAFLPAITVCGFLMFALWPVLGVLVAFQIIRRASNFAITRPGREILFSVITREQKYKSKNVIDTLVYRGGDAVSGWAFAGLSRSVGLDLQMIAIICVPVAALWMVLWWALGRRQTQRAGHIGRKLKAGAQ